MRRSTRGLTLLLALILAACDAGEAEGEQGAAEARSAASAEERPRTQAILLIVLDTLRADHLSLHGYARPTSPRLDDFAQRATVYAQAKATSPWTLPSHASLFTGLYPFEHGARTFDPAALEDPDETGNVGCLGAEHLTLAEVLRDAGYATAAIGANEGFLDARFGLDQGFEHYDIRRGRGPELNQRAFLWLVAHKDEPFFLFLNYMDTHRPYNCVEREGFPDCGTPKQATALLRELSSMALDQGLEPPPEKVARLVQQYDTSIANLDAALGELFDQLDAWGVLERALVIVTSDHGEYLGEHGLFEHSKDVYEEVQHVPLIVHHPGQDGRRDVDEAISIARIPALVLDHAQGNPERPASFDRHPQGAAVLAENYFSRMHDLNKPRGDALRRIRRAVYAGSDKLVLTGDSAVELYELEQDPGERTNRLDASAQRAAELRTHASAWPLPGPEVRPVLPRLDDEARETLRALGYAGDDE